MHGFHRVGFSNDLVTEVDQYSLSFAVITRHKNMRRTEVAELSADLTELTSVCYSASAVGPKNTAG